jgi:hypothetical protein
MNGHAHVFLAGEVVHMTTDADVPAHSGDQPSRCEASDHASGIDVAFPVEFLERPNLRP